MKTLMAALAMVLGCSASGTSAGGDGAVQGDAGTVDAPPSAPQTGEASWSVTCPPGQPGACPATTHQVRVTAGDPARVVGCLVTRFGERVSLSFRIASTDAPGDTFDAAREGLQVDGSAPAPGREMMGGIVIRGPGWITPGRIDLGGSNPCHVWIDTVEPHGFRGRFQCDRVPDDASPPRLRIVNGGGAGLGTFGQFAFSGCGG